METEAGVTLKNKLKKIIIITSVFSLIFVLIVCKEFSEKKGRTKRMNMKANPWL